MKEYMSEEQFNAQLTRMAKLADEAIAELLDKQTDIQPRLKEAMDYTMRSPGKRIRAAMILWICEMLRGTLTHEAKVAAAAMEMVHAYSLVHDDLPAMDNDDLRRGQPTVHKKFDEATAILTGDALLTLAFELLATEISDSALAIKLVGILAGVAGPAGMVAGQMADLMAENQINTIETLEYIHNNKTAMMFSGAAAMGALAGNASREQMHTLTAFGLTIGLGFQISDDILDVVSTNEQLGKTVGKDAQQGKATYPAIVGLDKSQKIAADIAQNALDLLNGFDSRADILRQLVFALLGRKK